tara:strand:- start:148 stop:540 length:393 start_codon:yes stop_codon:yes gene_type:complete
MSTFNEIKEEITALDDFDRYQYVVDWSDKGNDLPEELTTDKNFVKGCTSKLWCDIHDSKYKTRADALITQGLARMVCEIFNNMSIEEAQTFKSQTMSELGLVFSPSRANGMNQLIWRLKDLARERSDLLG